METKFEMGPLQKAWVQSLREHPERQIQNLLGQREGDDYKACCLGEALMCAHRMGIRPSSPFIDDHITSGYYGAVLNVDDYQMLGLRGSTGEISEKILGHRFPYSSLTSMNDTNVPWPDIANFIEKHPEAVFTKSV